MQGLLAGAPVTFLDDRLENAVRTQWESATGLTLSTPPEDTELANSLFTTLTARHKAIANLTGLEACTSLTRIDLAYNDVSDLSPLANLTGIRQLELGYGSPLAEQGINMQATGTNLITDLSPLANLANLTYLNIGGNTGVASIAAISTLASLRELWMGSQAISDWTPLSDRAESLEIFAEVGCGVANEHMPVFAGLTLLTALCISQESGLSDISPLASLNLGIAAFMNCPITDFSAAAHWTNLYMLPLKNIPIGSLASLAGLQNLQNLEIENCGISDISPLAGHTSIQRLTLTNNAIVDLSVAATLTGLTQLGLQNNQITDIQALLDNPGLGGDDSCDIRENPLSQDAACTQVPALRAKFNNPNNCFSNAICGPTVTLTISVVDTGNTWPAPGTYEVALGSTEHVEARPLNGTGWAFSHWTGDVSSASLQTDVFMDRDKTIQAVFITPGDHTLTVHREGMGSGYVFPEPGVYAYLHNQSPWVNVNPSAGSYFGGWQGDMSGFDINPSLLMDQDKSVTAIFETSGFTLTTQSVGTGQVYPWAGEHRYVEGAVVPLDAWSWGGWEFDHWEGDIGGADPSNATIEVTMDQNRTVTAVFEMNGNTLTIAVEGNDCGFTRPGAGQYTFNAGFSYTIEAHANAGCHFDHWEGDIGTEVPQNPVLTVLMDQDRAVTAVFASGGKTLTMAVGSGGCGTVYPLSGAHGYVEGSVVDLHAVPDAGCRFVHWEGDIGSADSLNRNIQVIMDQDRTITAVFEDWGNTLTLAVGGDGCGTTNPSPGLSGHDETENVTIQAIAQAGCRFDHWEGDIGTADSSSPVIQVAMDQDRAITAIFTYSGKTLTLMTGGTGCGTVLPPPGEHLYEEGGIVVIEALPGIECQFDHWEGDAVGSENPVSIVMDQDKTITAVFTGGGGEGSFLPKFIVTDFIELDKIHRISRFRSGAGHDYSPGDPESCRSMKHYYCAGYGLDSTDVTMFAPCDGTILWITQEWAGKQLGIAPDGYTSYLLILFHVTTTPEITVGAHVSAGQVLGTGSAGTWIDIALWSAEQQYSYFDAMTDAVYKGYLDRGVHKLSNLIIGEVERDADSLVCEGEAFASPSALPDFYYLEDPAEGEGGTLFSHSADQNQDGHISVSELLRIVQFYNSGGYHCAGAGNPTEDGYQPGPGSIECISHDSDYQPYDGRINLSELLRLIQFYNTGRCHRCPDQYTEDGFCLDAGDTGPE